MCSKSLLKSDMIKPIVSAVFTIMCKSDDPLQTKSNIETMLEDGENEEEDVDDTENLFTNSTQVLDYCALYFPAKKFITTLVRPILSAWYKKIWIKITSVVLQGWICEPCRSEWGSTAATSRLSRPGDHCRRMCWFVNSLYWSLINLFTNSVLSIEDYYRNK